MKEAQRYIAYSNKKMWEIASLVGLKIPHIFPECLKNTQDIPQDERMERTNQKRVLGGERWGERKSSCCGIFADRTYSGMW